MTQRNEEETRGRGGRGQRSSTDKSNPPLYRKNEGGRASSSSNRRGGGGTYAGGGSSGRSHSAEVDQMHEYANNVGEVDYTDGELGSVSSSTISASSPHSSVGSGGGGGGGRRAAANGGSAAGSSSSNGSKHKLRNKNIEPSARAPSPSSSSANGGVGGSSENGVAPIPGVSARPGGVPFGASALSKTMPSNGRGRPRGLRPRSSSSGTLGKPGSQQRIPSFSSSLGRHASSGSMNGAAAAGGGNSLARQGAPGATFQEAEAMAAEELAPGVPVDEAVRAAIKIESVMRVLIARGYVRRKLVSEVTAFSLIMERGIEVIKVGVSVVWRTERER